jgi:uncharacterized membrane protein
MSSKYSGAFSMAASASSFRSFPLSFTSFITFSPSYVFRYLLSAIPAAASIINVAKYLDVTPMMIAFFDLWPKFIGLKTRIKRIS